MSASREKMKRKEERELSPIREKAGGMSRETKVTAAIISTIVVVFILFLVVLGSGLPKSMATAVSVGTERLSVIEYTYFYKNTIDSYMSSLSQMGLSPESMGLNVNLALDRQAYPAGQDGETWEDYFIRSTNTSVQQMLALVTEARKNGFELSETARKDIDNTMKSLEANLASSGRKVNTFLSDYYGQGMNDKVMRKCLELTLLSQEYNASLQKQYEIDDKQIADEYGAAKDDYDAVDYLGYDFFVTDTSDEEAVAAARARAEEMLSRYRAGENFDALISEYSKVVNQDEDVKDDDSDEDVTPEAALKTGVSSYLLPTYKADWLFDEARKAGDSSVISNESNSTISVVVFMNRYRREESTVNVRHILIAPESQSGSSTFTDADWAAAETEAKRIYDLWKAGAADEAYFAQLAEEYTADTGSKANGGLYDDVMPGEMVPEFNDWCFDSSRKAGDSDIVKTDYGYHIMYYVSKGNPQWMVQVKNSLINKQHSAYIDSLLEKYPLSENNFGMSML